MTQATALATWFPSRKPSPRAKVRLFCFSYAGGGASVFRTWQAGLPPDVEVCAVETPGRETRFKEPVARSFPELVDGVLGAMAPLLDRPVALFGHSIGARVAFEVARRLAADRPGQPLCLIASASPSPRVRVREEAIHDLPHDEFVVKLRELEGTSAAVLENAELLELYEPILRGDFALSHSYEPVDESVTVPCPVAAYGGLEDKSVTSDHLAAWRDVAAGAFNLRRFPGNHFYLHKAQATLLDAVARDVFGALTPR